MEEEILIEKIIPGGQGIGTLKNGKKIFLFNVLPGEIIKEFKKTKEKSSYIEGVATKFIKTSKYRIEPKDECFLATSPWQIIDYQYELKLKTEIIVENFRQAEINILTPEIMTDNKDYFYRNKMEYALYWNNELEKIQLAFHERGSHKKIPVLKSSIERPEIWQRAVEIIDELNKKHEEARKYQSLLLRCNQKGEVSGGLLENGKSHPVFQELTDEIFGQIYNYSPNGFFQINLPVYKIALKEIKNMISTEKVLDLYSGVGTIGLSVAGEKELVLVENNKSAYNELIKNVNGKNKAILANSEDTLDYIQSEQTVIVDPPRAGCDKKLINKLLEVMPEKIIYLSCNPATQARDVKMLLEKYRIKQIKAFNFFPRTPHIENLVILEKI